MADGGRVKSAAELLERYAKGERDFVNVSLIDADLSGADLSGADLSGADLRGADLHEANLTDAKLSDAKLAWADLFHAGLSCANVGAADLSCSNLSYANVRAADLSHADLSDAILVSAKLTRANLTGADLTRANFLGADLASADFTSSTLRLSLFVDVDLSSISRAVGVVHRRRSTVDYRSIARSLAAPRLLEFLRATGMPELHAIYAIDSARALAKEYGVSALLQSTFISYGGPDEEFAKRLNAALQGQGVYTFFAPLDSVPGDTIADTMLRGVNDYDRVILVCSRDSLMRPRVEHEIKLTLEREGRDGQRYLIPVWLDDFAENEWKTDPKQIAVAVRDRVAADFRGNADFDEQVVRLLQALRKPVKAVPESDAG